MFDPRRENDLILNCYGDDLTEAPHSFHGGQSAITAESLEFNPNTADLQGLQEFVNHTNSLTEDEKFAFLNVLTQSDQNDSGEETDDAPMEPPLRISTPAAPMVPVLVSPRKIDRPSESKSESKSGSQSGSSRSGSKRRARSLKRSGGYTVKSRQRFQNLEDHATTYVIPAEVLPLALRDRMEAVNRRAFSVLPALVRCARKGVGTPDLLAATTTASFKRNIRDFNLDSVIPHASCTGAMSTHGMLPLDCAVMPNHTVDVAALLEKNTSSGVAAWVHALKQAMRASVDSQKTQEAATKMKTSCWVRIVPVTEPRDESFRVPDANKLRSRTVISLALMNWLGFSEMRVYATDATAQHAPRCWMRTTLDGRDCWALRHTFFGIVDARGVVRTLSRSEAVVVDALRMWKHGYGRCESMFQMADHYEHKPFPPMCMMDALRKNDHLHTQTHRYVTSKEPALTLPRMSVVHRFDRRRNRRRDAVACTLAEAPIESLAPITHRCLTPRLREEEKKTPGYLSALVMIPSEQALQELEQSVAEFQQQAPPASSAAAVASTPAEDLTALKKRRLVQPEVPGPQMCVTMPRSSSSSGHSSSSGSSSVNNSVVSVANFMAGLSQNIGNAPYAP